MGHKYDMQEIEAGLKDFVASGEETEETALTIEVLTAMTDFLSFKEMMLAKKAEHTETATLGADALEAMLAESGKLGKDLDWKVRIDDPQIRMEAARDDDGKELL